MTDFETQCLHALLAAYGPETVIGLTADWCSDNDRGPDADAIRGAMTEMKYNDEQGLS